MEGVSVFLLVWTGMKELTGGCSSVFSPRSGFALRFAKTPSLAEEKWPGTAAPGTAVGYLAAVGVKFGNSVTMRWSTAGLVPSCTTLCSSSDEWVPCISRCRSSPPLFPSASESSPSSNVSASVLSASNAIGSSEERKCRDAGDEARERKDGGGDEGIEFGIRSGRVGVVGSS